MNIARAKEWFQLGVIKMAHVRAPFGRFEGWTIELAPNVPNAEMQLETARGEIREFVTLDAAAKAVREIGIKTFDVITD